MLPGNFRLYFPGILTGTMKLRLLLCALCLITLLTGCRKTSHQSEPNSNISEGGGGAAADHAQAQSLLEKGKDLYKADQDTEAAQAFQEVVRLNPDLAEGYFRLGLAYEALNKQQEAEEQYKKAVDTYKKYLLDNPKDAEAHYNLGQTFAGLHLFSEAVKEYRQATKLKTDDADIYYDLGTALTKLAQYDEAVAAFSKSLEIDPENYRAQDALEDAQDGSKRIRDGRKHQAELLKKQKDDELKNGEGGTSEANSQANRPVKSANPKPSTTKSPGKP